LGELWFKASPGKTFARPCLTTKGGVVAHNHYSSHVENTSRTTAVHACPCINLRPYQNKKDWDVAQVVEHLPDKCKILVQTPVLRAFFFSKYVTMGIFIENTGF
jgi:hypothetical protein